MTKPTPSILADPNLTDWERGMLFQNVQRTKLSNERNFLNWLRTSVAFITLGFVTERFHLLMGVAGASGSIAESGMVRIWLPLALFVLGGLVLSLGTWEFFRVRKEIFRGEEFEAFRTNTITNALVVVAFIFLVFVLAIFFLGNAPTG